ncbi:fumarylacetoacetate hydrolase family protein [Rhodospirillaceae bacterium KN72]|uniref:Fumarylacetoacetate hydrolase family protein n=1 Tax=Pacificispira spongiicola TaxID=2729598 RepID=A0A7Y0HE90_9PROT|nr:fumarylacetoacetate hydrolase family protein [Pacificispira spongiicola]NMM43283.1 fumarylacetoacetate hydrolase family protein [Pacificispira spongiicola]
MADLVFAAPETQTLPIQGSEKRVPVNRIFCVGRNYEEHAKEMGVEVDRQAAFYFLKGNYATIESGAKIAYPPGTSNYHYEMELSVVIGKPAYQVAKDKANDVIFGYACSLDMTRRDLQLVAREKGRPWDLGKDFEQSAVFGEVVPVEKTGILTEGAIELRQNGETKQSADLSQLVWKIDELISDLSKYYHLQPGDVIMTGTPAGVGPVKSGDVIEGSVAGVGDIRLEIE